MRKLVKMFLSVALVALMVAGCSSGGSSDTPSTPPPSSGTSSSGTPSSSAPQDGDNAKVRVALIVNQRFGDGGVVDDMGRGAEEAAADFDVELKTLESESQATHEEDLRAIAQDGYDLIITTFTPMSEATKLVAQEFPDTAFVAVYQYINDSDEKVANVRSLEFRGNEGLFVEGYVAGLISQTGHLGFAIGGEEPGTNAECNGWLLGAASAKEGIQLEYGNINSFEDPVKAKEITTAMISKGVDYMHVPSSKSGNGIIEAITELDKMADSDVKDYYDVSDHMVGYCGMGFDTAVYSSIQQFVEGTLELGVHGIMDLTNGGYYMDWSAYERYAEANPDMKDVVLNAVEKGKQVEADIVAGNLVIEFDPAAPDTARALANAKTELW